MSMTEGNNFGRGMSEIHQEGKDTGLAPQQYTVTIRDSINQLFPTCKLLINDDKGSLNEYLAFVDGTPFSVFLDSSNQGWKESKFVVCGNSNPEQKTNRSIAGYLEIQGIQECWFNLKNEQKCYKDKDISDIIKKLKFISSIDKKNIDGTSNKGLWYQPNMDDAEFLEKILLPFAFSTSAKNSPFYAWIDNDGEFNFKSLTTMLGNKPVVTLGFGEEEPIDTRILTFKSLQTDFTKIRKNLVTTYDDFDETGAFVEADENKVLVNYPKQNKDVTYRAELGNVTKDLFKYVQPDLTNEEDENNQKGFEAFNNKKSIMQDKVIITTYINRKIKSGQLVEIKIKNTGDNKDDLTSRWNGTYIVEVAEHTWNQNMALTTCVLCKQSTKLSDQYLYKNYLAKE